MENNTIFDDVFRTMLEKMPQLVIPVINEVFHTSYSKEEKINQYRNEHHKASGEIITDSYLGIGNKLYHLECESRVKGNMVIRMIEYDFAAALEDIALADGIYEMNFPHSCILYLRHNKNTPNHLNVRINMPDGQHIIYSVPTIKLQEYTKDDIFRKKLLFFLPFYIMRYEKELHSIEKDSKKTIEMVEDIESLIVDLKKEFSSDEEMELYTRLAELMERISDYILNSEKNLKERIGAIMGGKILELETDKILERGREQGLEQGLEQATTKIISQMLKENVSWDKIILYTGCTREDIEKISRESLA